LKRLPTDIEILNEVYERYYDVFAQYVANARTTDAEARTTEDEARDSKIYVPIDIAAIASGLRVDGDIVFGRLYYYLEERYGYTKEDGSRVHFFALRAGKDRHCVNFPLLGSVLADLRDQARKHGTATWIAVGSLVVSLVSIAISILS
jgi:hypothetical protein